MLAIVPKAPSSSIQFRGLGQFSRFHITCICRFVGGPHRSLRGAPLLSPVEEVPLSNPQPELSQSITAHQLLLPPNHEISPFVFPITHGLPFVMERRAGSSTTFLAVRSLPQRNFRSKRLLEIDIPPLSPPDSPFRRSNFRFTYYSLVGQGASGTRLL